jgi:hypothetical protein
MACGDVLSDARVIFIAGLFGIYIDEDFVASPVEC